MSRIEALSGAMFLFIVILAVAIFYVGRHLLRSSTGSDSSSHRTHTILTGIIPNVATSFVVTVLVMLLFRLQDNDFSKEAEGLKPQGLALESFRTSVAIASGAITHSVAEFDASTDYTDLAFPIYSAALDSPNTVAGSTLVNVPGPR